MRSSFSRFACAGLVAASFTASAQQTPAAAPPSSNWERVEALPANTFVHVKAGRRHTICAVATVDEATLTCSRDTGVGHTQLSFARGEITSIKLARRGHSALLGAAILGGAGAVAGGIQGASSNYFAVKGAWAMVYGFSGLFAGAPIGYLTDFSASTIYRAP